MSSMREGIPLDALNWFGRAIRNSHPKISRPWRVKNLGFVCSPSFFSLPAACRLFSRGVIFTWARVSLALLSLRKNGGLLVVYLVPSGNSASQTSSANKLRATRSTDQSTRVLHDLKELKDLQHQSLTSMQQLIATMNSLISLMEVFFCPVRGKDMKWVNQNQASANVLKWRCETRPTLNFQQGRWPFGNSRLIKVLQNRRGWSPRRTYQTLSNRRNGKRVNAKLAPAERGGRAVLDQYLGIDEPLKVWNPDPVY